MIGIYKITNPKHKLYIGQTVDWKRRQDEYKQLNCSNQKKLYNSLAKYGWSNHTFELIEECILDDLNNRERYWQDYYNVLEKGLNLKLTQCDDKSGVVSQETKDKISLSMEGKNTWSIGGHNKRSVLQYDLQGNFIKKYTSAEEVRKIYGIDVGNCCRGANKTSMGCIWFYEDSFNNDILTERMNKAIVHGLRNKPKSEEHKRKISLSNLSKT